MCANCEVSVVVAGGLDLELYLQRLPYFAGLTSARLTEIAAHAALRSATAGEALFFEGEPSAGLWMIAHGRVKFFKLRPNGQEHILRLCGDGDTFNDIGAFDGGVNPANATALSPTSLYVLPTSFLRDLIARDGTFALRVIEVLSGRLRYFTHQIENLALYPVLMRLARFLLQQTDNPSLSGQGVTRALIAAHLATTPQTISTVLRDLELLGAIRFDRQQVTILDEDILRSIASE